MSFAERVKQIDVIVLFGGTSLDEWTGADNWTESAGVQTASLHLQGCGAESAGDRCGDEGNDCIVADDPVEWPSHD